MWPPVTQASADVIKRSAAPMIGGVVTSAIVELLIYPVVCHADNRTLLQRQPTAFHANIQRCTTCHLEHRGRNERPTNMDHVALARIGLRQMEQSSEAGRTQTSQIKGWLEQTSRVSFSAYNLKKEERTLNCATCHKTKDRHFGLFGNDCAQCHSTKQWTVAEFRHPSASSQSCAQCHQAPPSHYMEHFNMVSKKIALPFKVRTPVAQPNSAAARSGEIAGNSVFSKNGQRTGPSKDI